MKGPGLHITPHTLLAACVPPLTKAELAWARKLEALFACMPARLRLLEHGDGLSIIDREAASVVDLYDGQADKNGVLLADVGSATMKVTSCSA